MMQQFKMCSCSVPHGYIEEKICRECAGISPYYIRQIEAHNLELVIQSRKDSDRINDLVESGLRQQAELTSLRVELAHYKAGESKLNFKKDGG